MNTSKTDKFNFICYGFCALTALAALICHLANGGSITSTGHLSAACGWVAAIAESLHRIADRNDEP